MQTYRDFRPTKFDSHIPLEDREDWLVVPVARNRDSEPYEESNFAAALKTLGGESDNVEVHRFGHWANGWFEIILASPTLATEVQDIQDSLDNYPILDEDDLLEREDEVKNQDWNVWLCLEWLETFTHASWAAQYMCKNHPNVCYDFAAQHGMSLEYEHEGTTITHAEHLTRDETAALIRACRKDVP